MSGEATDRQGSGPPLRLLRCPPDDRPVTVTVEQPRTRRELTAFLRFADEVNAERTASWPVLAPMQLPFVSGQGPDAHEREVRPLVAREDGRIAARVVAVDDAAYRRRWDDGVGHLSLFEALPGRVESIRTLMNEACDWLRSRGATAARAGLGAGPDLPFVVDDYESLPPLPVRHNPPGYHTLLHEAGFGVEKSCLDYVAEATPEHVARWERIVEEARARGFRLVPLGEVAPERRIEDFARTWNEAFADSWGMTPTPEEEFEQTFAFAGPRGMDDFSVVAYRDGRPMGVASCGPTLSGLARLAPGRVLAPWEGLRFFGVGVRAQMRGQGLGLALTAQSFLAQYRMGATHLGYTMVLADNWASRRTAERLGARIRATYLIYRRDFR